MASYFWPPQIGSGGTVTSVGLTDASTIPIFSISNSPVTSSGTLTLTLVNESANIVFAGPTSGPSAQPSFRLLVAGDIPSLPYVVSVSASPPLFSSGGQNPNITIQQSDATHNGYLSSVDWSTFNSKQPAGSYITALTGDATASGPGSSVLTLATVNGNVGSFGDASHSLTLTANAKGLITAVSSNSIQIAESQVTNLVSDLAGKQPTGNYITALTGDITAAGPGSVAASLVATTNSTLTTLSALSLPVGQLTGTLSIAHGGTGQTSFAAGALSSNGTTLTSGTLAVSNGGTGASTLILNNVILGNGTSAVQFVAPSTSGNVLTSNGTTWQSTAPAASTPKAPTVQSFLTGSGTYTTPSSPTPLYLKVRVVGAGGGGGGTGPVAGSQTSGGNGTSSSFASSAVLATGGQGGPATTTATAAVGGPSGGGSITTSATILQVIAVGAGSGGGITSAGTATAESGGNGGDGYLGGGAGVCASGHSGDGGSTNTGGGGAGGGGTTAIVPGAGGGAGGYAEAIITSPSATYTYAVGSPGSAGLAGLGGFGGGQGGSGIVIVEEFYQ